MSLSGTFQEVESLEAQLNEVAKRAAPPPGAKKVFIAIPNMIDVNAMLVNKLFMYAMQHEFAVRFQIVPEVRFHDHARNRIAVTFMESDADYLVMVDADVDPNPKLLEMVRLDKDIASGNIFCWINGQVMPSIWTRAACEQCVCTKKYVETGIVHDPSQYRVVDLDTAGKDALFRWNPFRQQYESLATREGIIDGRKCRCLGTGLDPFVYRVHPGVVGQGKLLQCDSVGAASLVVARRVFEKLSRPWFQFLYKEMREIMLTEDHFFCWRAKLQGFEVWADPQMAGSHYKTVDLFAVNTLLVRAWNLGREQLKAEMQAPPVTSIIMPALVLPPGLSPVRHS